MKEKILLDSIVNLSARRNSLINIECSVESGININKPIFLNSILELVENNGQTLP